MKSLHKRLVAAHLLAALPVGLPRLDALQVNAQPQPQSPQPSSVSENVDQGGFAVPVPRGDRINGVNGLKQVYRYINTYRATHKGAYPAQASVLFIDMTDQPTAYGLTTRQESLGALLNPDTRFSDNPSESKSPGTSIPYFVGSLRPDGVPFEAPKPSGTRNAPAWLKIYSHVNAYRPAGKQRMANPTGFWQVLWEDGVVEEVPFDQILFMPSQHGFYQVFRGQAGVPSSITYEEYWTQVGKSDFPAIGKPIIQGKDAPIPDNGGPESLVALSRLLSFPSRYGIEREAMWKNFDPAQEEFTLANIQAGAAKLNLPLDLKPLTLDELHKLNAPAIFLTSDDKRLVVLSQLDDKEAIVIDRGLTRIVSRDLLAQRYGGQVLVATSTSTPVPGVPQVLAEDPVRSLSLTSPAQAITQTVKISNTGNAPLTLQVERPIPGAEKAELSASILAPGQSATLSLTLRWRSLLKSPTQNVLVFLATNDPRRPRLPLGFKLSLPQANPAAP